MYKNQYTQLVDKKATIADEQRPLVSELEQLHNRILEVTIEADTISVNIISLYLFINYIIFLFIFLLFNKNRKAWKD